MNQPLYMSFYELLIIDVILQTHDGGTDERRGYTVSILLANSSYFSSIYFTLTNKFQNERSFVLTKIF